MGNPFNTEPRKDATGRFMEWYNYRRAHMSLDWENRDAGVHPEDGPQGSDSR